jgi:hypothetical protein
MWSGIPYTAYSGSGGLPGADRWSGANIGLGLATAEARVIPGYSQLKCWYYTNPGWGSSDSSRPIDSYTVLELSMGIDRFLSAVEYEMLIRINV